MIPSDIIEQNKTKFLELVNEIEREGFAKESMIELLEKSDFFIAPATTKYHGSYEGGLCEHCLNVYKNLKLLVERFPECNVTTDTLLILSLFHDISKINLYKKDFRNKKVYHETGSKSDSMGRYDWVSEEIYSIDNEDRFIYGNHEQTSEFLVRQYIPLTIQESVALLHHHGGMSWDSTQTNISEIYNRYPIVTLLHTADLLASYIDQHE